MGRFYGNLTAIRIRGKNFLIDELRPRRNGKSTLRVKSDTGEGRDEREVHWHPRCFSTDSALYGRKVIPQPNKNLCAVLLPSNVTYGTIIFSRRHKAVAS